MIRDERLKIKAKMFRGFADSTRLAILECLRDGEKTVSEIVEEIKQTQSNVSNHLSCLLGCGLIKNKREGKNIFYRITNNKIKALLEGSDSILDEIYSQIYECVRYEE